MEVEATRAAPAFKQAELPLALLVSSVGTAAWPDTNARSALLLARDSVLR